MKTLRLNMAGQPKKGETKKCFFFLLYVCGVIFHSWLNFNSSGG
ncbi:unnamed protein product [Larinioides sclopetarius]|uniref:Photosystem II protein L n=1 Tax=Larinioides sclopetarius TaxID=280406 RepID=A0AAV1ZJE2_9ARAC